MRTDGWLELFNLGDDIGERRNLVQKESAGANHMFQLLNDSRISQKAAMPELNPDYPTPQHLVVIDPYLFR